MVYQVLRPGKGTCCLFFIGWLLLSSHLVPGPSSLYGQTGRPYDLPNQPIEFAAHEPNRPNALDLMGTVNGYLFLRYQRATGRHFSFQFDLNGYLDVINLFRLFGSGQYTVGVLDQDIRVGAGFGLAFWPWEKLRKGYIGLRGQLQMQFLDVTIAGAGFSRSRFLMGNSLEIGARLGRRVPSFGLFGGIGFQAAVEKESVLPEGYSLPMIYAYFGFSFGLNFR
ncbi:hypothetical protein P0082_07970 [Candidatus Haliotispira prima]|uniref:Outer membrane protein beta-barrel domain-containing protein n=1 Tax=Candidatus Haliotispira prima TaxID=3034016 RepID=A0ABY8MEQ1_9SPIO|nr:hypothetical protein P0082_07970 [Candidatus Haliotispira prima]